MSHAADTIHWTDFKRPVSRWTPLRKAALIAAIQAGHLDKGEMLARHNIEEGEYADWLARHRAGGAPALRATTRPGGIPEHRT